MKIFNTSGRRKHAVARAVLKEGKGNVRINLKSLEVYEPEVARLRIMEPLVLSGLMGKYDISVNVYGGGWQSQSEASRLAIARALVAAHPELKKQFMEYDRQLLIADVRFNESHKPNDSKPRAKRQKSYR
ncbi:30S ribosomal protein S9 [Candidatus Woesearchaeota archaeon]|nr:30S ribosomal protein S9 [Candidatus Woesearchaeota archaeon]